MVDAPNWGQDWEFRMRDNAASILNADPLRNTVFSIHMYGVFETRPVIEDYLLHFVNAGLPLVIGEFGHFHTDEAGIELMHRELKMFREALR